MSIEDTLDERESRYGSFAGHALISQALTDVMRAAPSWSGLGASQKEALEMIAHKIARTLNGSPYYIDNWHDIAGYATLVERELQPEPTIGDGMTFGLAIEAVKRGAKVARPGWNGKGLWIALSCAACREVSAENFWSPANADFARTRGGSAIVLPYLTMKTADDQIVPWVASQSDILAEDWEIVE